MTDIQVYLKKWNLTAPTKLTETPTSHVYKVQRQSEDAVLKILTPLGKKDEAFGSSALKYFGGSGAVVLLNSDEGAHLVSFADGRFLKDVVVQGKDGEASEIICQLLAKLHSFSKKMPSGIKSMPENFEALFRRAKEIQDPILVDAVNIVSGLLEAEHEPVLLHGDIHHKNILECSRNGWIAIDPKGLIGEPIYDLANVFFNPEDLPELVENSDRIYSTARIFSKFFRVDQDRILRYAFAYGCLSACWAIEDGLNPTRRLRIAKMIQKLL